MAKEKKQEKIVLSGDKGERLKLLRVKEKIKKQEKELYEKEHPILTKLGKAEEKIDKKISKALRKKLVSRKVLKPSQLTMTIKQREPEPYKSRFFKDTIEQEKRSMFFD